MNKDVKKEFNIVIDSDADAEDINTYLNNNNININKDDKKVEQNSDDKNNS